MKIRENNNDIKISVVKRLNNEEQTSVEYLQKLAFKNIDAKEVKEDFYHPKSAHILAYMGDELIGWAGIHETEQVYEGKNVKLGGYGICTHPNWRGRGIATKVSKAALFYLKRKGCDVGFLSVDLTNTASIKLHQKNGFVMFPRYFSWINSKGEIKKDKGIMITPINSQKLFEHIQNGKDILFIGNGYW